MSLVQWNPLLSFCYFANKIRLIVSFCYHFPQVVLLLLFYIHLNVFDGKVEVVKAKEGDDDKHSECKERSEGPRKQLLEKKHIL